MNVFGLSPLLLEGEKMAALCRQFAISRKIGHTGFMERAMGIEPTSEAWEASILPLYDARSFL